MTGKVTTLAKRVAHAVGRRRGGPVILWRNEGEGADAVIARHLAEHPGDAKKRIHVVMWRRPNEESAAAAIARKLDEDPEDATRRTDLLSGGRPLPGWVKP